MKKKLAKKEKKEIFAYLQERFGFTKEFFKEYSYFKTQRKVYMTTKECVQNLMFGLAETSGLALVRPNSVWKPTTDFLQLLGKHAKKNVVVLSKEQAEKYVKGQDIDAELNVDSGYVIIKYKEILGCANYKEGTLKNMLPKSRRANIKL